MTCSRCEAASRCDGDVQERRHIANSTSARAGSHAPAKFRADLATHPGRGACYSRRVARIRTLRDGDNTRVIISGRVTAADMGRIEHACAPALLVRPSPLELDLRQVSSVDATAIGPYLL